MTTEIITIGEAREVQSQNVLSGNLLERFIAFAGVMPKTQSTYKTALRQMFKYFMANEIEKPTREDLIEWRDKLIADKKSPSTVQLYLTSCKIFFRWLAQEGIFPNIADHLKSGVKISHDHKKDALSAPQAGSLIQSVKGDSLKCKRDRAIIALMVSSGLRCIEVVRADVGDMVNQFGRDFLLVQGKGHFQKDAQVLLPLQVVNLIQEYLQARGNVEDSEPLFTSCANRNRGSRLSSQTLSKMVKANLRAAGFDSKRLTAHSLRATAATTMIIAGVELTQVQQVLRHVNVNTTLIYNKAVQRLKNTAEQTAADSIFATISPTY